MAEAVGAAHLGRGLGRYEAATLLGAFVGSLAAGFLYDAGTWAAACLACAALTLAGAALVPRAVARLGLPDHPSAVPSTVQVAAPATPPTAAPLPREERVGPTASRRRLLTDLAWHTVLLGAAQLAGRAADVDGLLATALRTWVVVWCVDVVWTVWTVRTHPAPPPPSPPTPS